MTAVSPSDFGETSVADMSAGVLDVISMPAHPPPLTPGLVRALARLIYNSPSHRTAEVVEIDGTCHARALAS